MQEWQHGVTLIEGHRRHKGAKYEVIAPGAWNDSYCKTQGTANLVGLISDEKLDTALPVFRRDDYVGLLDHADGLWQNSKAHKQLVRRYINWLKRQHSAGDLRLKSGVICDQIRKEPAYELAKNILLYWPMAGEVDLTPLLEQAGDKVFCLPIVEADGQLSLGVYQGWKGLVENSMGISEPLGAPRLAIETIDLILTPGMAFTRCGKRLGRGGGFYDRLLEKRLARQSFWGIGFDFQVLDDLPMAEHDHPVDRVFWG
jgi:5-formyltetrahydrofolate cyclo-ligase